MHQLIQQNIMIDFPLQLQHSHQESKSREHEQQPQVISEQEEEKQEDLEHVPCHPHRPARNFDFSGIQEQIKAIRLKKEMARQAALRTKKIAKNKQQIYEADVIQETLEEAMDLVPQHISMSIKQRTKFIEDKVYIAALNQSFGQLVSRIKQEVLGNQALGNELNLVMSEVQINIENDIQEGVYDIHKVERKQKVIPVEPEPAHRVKLKNMLIKSKIVGLRDEFNKSELDSPSLISASVDNSIIYARKQGQIWGDEFHILSEGTKKAQQFVKRIRREQQEQKKAKIRKAQEMKSLEVKSAMEHKQFEEQMKKQRHETLKQRYIQVRQHKKKEKQIQQEKEKQFLSFVKEYKGKKPLFRVKEEQYIQNVVEQQIKKRKRQLQEIHSARKSITKEELIEHEKNYAKLKEEKDAIHNAERQMRRKEVANLPHRSYYRGRYHSFIKQEEQQKKNVPDPNIARDELLKKQKEFGEFVRKKYAPHVDQKKRKELEQLIATLDQKGGKKGLSEQEYKKMGNDYLKHMHKMIEQLRKKGLIKSKVVVEQNDKKIDYLKQRRDRYNFSTIDYASQANSNAQWVHSTALKKEDDARKKQQVMKHYDNSFDFEKYMKDIKSINEDYISSAQAKMSLINKLQRSGTIDEDASDY